MPIIITLGLRNIEAGEPHNQFHAEGRKEVLAVVRFDLRYFCLSASLESQTITTEGTGRKLLCFWKLESLKLRSLFMSSGPKKFVSIMFKQKKV